MTNSGREDNDASMVEVISLLLEKGARYDVKNNDGVTAIKWAAGSHKCSLETFTVLLRACADAETIKTKRSALLTYYLAKQAYQVREGDT
jgi:hypothetical protein